MPPFATTHPPARSRTAPAHTLRQISREPFHPARPSAPVAPAPGATALAVTVYLPADSSGSPDAGALRTALEHLAALGHLTVVPPPSAPAPDSTSSRTDQRSPQASARVDARSRTVTRDGQEIALSRLEFGLLEHLLRHRGRVFTRGQLLTAVWGTTFTGTRTVDVHVRRLRQKLDIEPLVHTVRGVGYRLATNAPVTLTQ